MAKKYYRGEYIVINKNKYIGNKNPIYRSSYEARVCYFFDHNPNIIKWGYECIKIPYFNVMDKKAHTYYPDFYIEERNKSGELKKLIVEVKPVKQSVPPKAPKNANGRSQRRYMLEAKTYVINQCKWETAREYCKKLGWEFKTITENDIFQ